MRSSFTATEFARLILPGFYFGLVSLLLLWALAYANSDVRFTEVQQILLFLFLSVTSGLTMYLRETPKRRRAFSENQPSQAIQQIARTMKGAEALSDDDARRLYFHFLNNTVSSVAHEKIFFFGAIYHIVVHIRRTTFWFAILSTIILGYYLSQGIPVMHVHGLLILGITLWAVYVLNVQYNKADRNMQENYQDQILWVELNRDLVEKTIRAWKR